LTVHYTELETDLAANFTIVIGEDPAYRGDTNGDYLINMMDIFEFSLWWQQPDARLYSPCDRVNDEKVNSSDLLWLFDYWQK
jgi:hypothetical protein